MTNKMPEVGKRYKPKNKTSFDWAVFKRFSLINGGTMIFCDLRQFCNDGKSNGYCSCPLQEFWNRFEELPPQTKEKSQFKFHTGPAPETKAIIDSNGNARLYPDRKIEEPKSQEDDKVQEVFNIINRARIRRQGYDEGWNDCFEAVKKAHIVHALDGSNIPQKPDSGIAEDAKDCKCDKCGKIIPPGHCAVLSANGRVFCSVKCEEKSISIWKNKIAY
jgi:hypothetical protein